MPDHSFSKEIFPNIQSKAPLAQLEAISYRPIYSLTFFPTSLNYLHRVLWPIPAQRECLLFEVREQGPETQGCCECKR